MFFRKEKQYKTHGLHIGHNFHFEQAQPYFEPNSVIFYSRTNTKYRKTPKISSSKYKPPKPVTPEPSVKSPLQI